MTGRLEPELSDIDGAAAVRAPTRDVVQFGERERDPGERAAIAETAITVLDLDALRAGARWRFRRARTGSTSTPTCSTARWWAPSTRPRPAALTFEELAALLRDLVAGPAVGVQVTVFDPDLDPDGSQARALTDCLGQRAGTVSASIALREVKAGLRAALYGEDAPALGDDAEPVARRRHVRQPAPAARARVVELDLLDRARVLLAARDHDPPVAQRGGRGAAA